VNVPQAPSKEDRLAMLMSKIDDIVNSVVRQCSFDNYEQQVHEARAKGQLAPADFCQMWEKSVVDYYGAPGEVNLLQHLQP
jgi:oligoendopeptidase F